MFGTVDTIHPVDPHSLDGLRNRYPSLANVTSFADVVRVSSRYLATHAIKMAGDHAEDYFRTHPRMNLESIDQDTALAESMGLLAFLTDRSEALRPITIQPSLPLEPDLRPDLPSRPPRPPDDTLPRFYDLHNGAPIILPDKFIPNGCPDQQHKPYPYALAEEYLHLKDQQEGLSIVFPLTRAQALFAAAGLPLNSTPTSIVAATGKPQGRLVADSSRSGINHLSKKAILTSQRGPIANPTHPHWCTLFDAVRRLFPGQQLYMFKKDFKSWFKRTRIKPDQVGLLAMVFHINGLPYVVIPLVGQFGCQEYNYISAQVAAVIHARARNHDILSFGGPLSNCYADDTAGFIVMEHYEAHDVIFTANAVAHAGIDAAPDDKKAVALVLTVVGAMYDVSDMDYATIGVSEAIFLKLICLLFLEIPRVLTPGVTRLKLHAYMRIGSYMYLVSNYIPMVKPFTHAVYENIAGVPLTTHSVKITERTAIDLAFWRSILFLACLSVKWLSVPMFIPPLISRPKEQSLEAFAEYQAANAHYIIGTDAATLGLDVPNWGAGFTAHAQGQPFHLWGEYDIPSFAEHFRSTNVDTSQLVLPLLDQINLYEAIAMVLACEATLRSLPADRPAHVVLFVWCDNTSAISWLTKYKNHHPVVNFLLQVWCRLQANHNATILSGHIRGLVNVIPDAISRHFQVSDGSAILASLAHMTPQTSLPLWYHYLLIVSSLPSNLGWQTTADLLIALAQTL